MQGVCAQVRAKLERAGTPIGPFDTLIAAQAVARKLVLVSTMSESLGGLRASIYRIGQFSFAPGPQVQMQSSRGSRQNSPKNHDRSAILGVLIQLLALKIAFSRPWERESDAPAASKS